MIKFARKFLALTMRVSPGYQNSLDCIKMFTSLSLTSVERRNCRHEDLNMFDSINFHHDLGLRGLDSDKVKHQELHIIFLGRANKSSKENY